MLKQFKQEGVSLACVTNKPRQFVLPLLQKLGLDTYFTVLVCGDDLVVKKLAPAPLSHAIHQLESIPERGYMVGDSATDIIAARRADAGAIYVSYGYNRGVSVEQYDPICINNLKELLHLFTSKSVLDVSSSY